MNPAKIAIDLKSFGLPLRQALWEAQRLSVAGAQANAAGDLAPRQLSRSGRGEVRILLRSHQVEMSALRCPSVRGLANAADQQERIEHIQAVLTLGVDLGARVVVLDVGAVPNNGDEPAAARLVEALKVLACHAERFGTVLALESGYDAGAALSDFLERFDTGGLGVSFDPVNFFLHDLDPGQSARALGDKIVHVRATDIRRGAVQEVPLGQGELDWPHYLEVLEEIGYRGWLTVGCNNGGNSTFELAAGISFLERVAATAK